MESVPGGKPDFESEGTTHFSEKAEAPQPDPVNDRVGHVVAVWRETTLIWGGEESGSGSHDSDIQFDPAVVHSHRDGVWTAKTTSGQIPPATLDGVAEVIGDSLYLFGGRVDEDSNSNEIYRLEDSNSNEIYRLELNTWVWSKLEPKGTRPLKSSFMVSWVCGEKMFIFGGECDNKEAGTFYPAALEVVEGEFDTLCNQLVFYDCRDNSWNWPTALGTTPSPRNKHAAFHVEGRYSRKVGSLEKCFRSLAFVFGGQGASGDELNDLHFLDMVTMKWELVHHHDPVSDMNPEPRAYHSLTRISSKAAVLFGGFNTGSFHWWIDGSFRDCWHLNIGNCVAQEGEDEQAEWRRMYDIWTYAYGHADQGWRSSHRAVQEPNSRRIWMIGGVSEVGLDDEKVDHIRELTFAAPSLKVLALESVAGNYKKLESEIRDLPETFVLRQGIEAKAARKYTISHSMAGQYEW